MIHPCSFLAWVAQMGLRPDGHGSPDFMIGGGRYMSQDVRTPGSRNVNLTSYFFSFFLNSYTGLFLMDNGHDFKI